jgi:hypothetical protein
MHQVVYGAAAGADGVRTANPVDQFLASKLNESQPGDQRVFDQLRGDRRRYTELSDATRRDRLGICLLRHSSGRG